jgi:nucleotide-binding universal stress UspA family protein
MTTARSPAIVVGVSGSRASVTALGWAAGEAARLHGRLHAVLAWTAPSHASYAPSPPPLDQEKCRECAHRDLAAAVRAVFGPAPPDYVVTEVVEGQPERALTEKSAGADLLVLGLASACGLAGRSLGPVIRTCLSRAHCPVVVVGPEDISGGSPADAAGAAREFADATS